ncbi:MAG: ATP-binding cassette domain-containing protein [Clostridia bacterium]|nr:ATP-binding cassette domain-containing protein [Clostridia bacterium]
MEEERLEQDAPETTESLEDTNAAEACTSAEDTQSTDSAALEPAAGLAKEQDEDDSKYVVRIKHVNKTFKSKEGTVNALQDINLDIRYGEILGVIGFSGAGKSTLARCVNVLERPDSGEVLFCGRDILKLKGKELYAARGKIGMIFQNFNLLQQRNTLKNVMYPLEAAGVKKDEAIAKATSLLEEVKLGDKLKSYPSQLSGGQKQRVAIARALALDPELLICDEATSALDPETAQQIVELLLHINKTRNLSIFVVSHQLNIVRSLCNRIAVIEDGQIMERGTLEEVFTNPQSRAAKRLLAYEGASL